MGGRKKKAKPHNNKKEEKRQRQAFKKRKNRYQYGDAEWNADFEKFQKQLGLGGLMIKDVAGDGNCLFRAIADQLVDNPNKHAEYRQKIMDFVEANREDYEPFVEDDIPFDTYIADMRKLASWGGHIEIQACSVLYECNVIIHQLDQPRWEVNNHQIPKKTIHLSYHDGDHYASVRSLDGGYPPSDVYTVAIQTPVQEAPANDLEKVIIETSGCTDLALIRSVCEDCQWDVNEAIAMLMTINETAGGQGAQIETGQVAQVYQPVYNYNQQPGVQNGASKHHKDHPILESVVQHITNKERKIQAKVQKIKENHYSKKKNKKKQKEAAELPPPPVEIIAKDLGALCI